MIDDNNQIDELFRKSLNNYKAEPSDNTWNIISQNISSNNNKNNKKYLLLLLALIVIIAISIYTYHTITNNEIVNNFNDKHKSNISINSTNKQIITQSKESLNNTTPNKYKYAIIKEKNKNEELLKDENHSKMNTLSNLDLNSDNIQEIKSEINKENNNITDKEIKTLIENENPKIDEPKLEIFEKTDSNKLITSIDKENKKDSNIVLNTSDKKEEKSIKKNKIINYFIELCYTPEYYTSNSKLFSSKEDYKNNTDLSLTLSNGYFKFRTGIGISFNYKDNWDYNIDYTKYENIGDYSRVDSLQFNVTKDPVSQELVVNPKFYTTKIFVYDFVNHRYTSEINRTSIYYQIPFVLGYTVKEYKRISVTANIGGIYSILSTKKTDKLIYPDNKDKIIKVENNEISRINTNWNIIVNFGFTYRAFNNIYINIEPTYKKSISKIYKDSYLQPKALQSIGLRTGVMIKL